MKLYWANTLMDRSGFSSTPYRLSHYNGCYTKEKAEEIVKDRVEEGGVLLSYIQEVDTDTDETQILDLESYVSIINPGGRQLHIVDEYLFTSVSRIIVYEINDNVWSKNFQGDTLYEGEISECPEEIRKRKVCKVWDSDEEKARKFIVFKEDK